MLDDESEAYSIAMLDTITLDQLRLLTTIAEVGSFSAAGRRLGRVQSAVSYGIANLEAQLELELFDRSSRKPRLTEAGRAIVEEARQVLARVATLTSRARSLTSGVEAVLSLAVDVAFPSKGLVALCRRFRERWPEVSLRLRSEALGSVTASVRSGEADIGVGNQFDADAPGLSFAPAGELRMVPVASPDHPLGAIEGPIDPSVLREHTQLVLTDPSGLTGDVDHGVYSPDTWRLTSLETKRTLLRAGLGFGGMPVHMVEDDIASGELKMLRGPLWSESGVALQLAAVWLQDHPLGPAGRWVLSVLPEVCGDQPG